jgi:BarA-like signal transduction histidine kinase
MDLLDKVEEIAMTNLSILYNTNLMPFVICALPSPANVKQERLNVKEELHEHEISIPTRRKEPRGNSFAGLLLKR